MPRKGGFGCLLLLVAGGVVVYAVGVLPALPWWAVAFGVLFYAALLRRLRAGRSAGLSMPLEGDDRTPFPIFRNRGF